jgi:hypothetical protein
MEPSEIRKKLHGYIDMADEESLNFIFDVVAEYKNVIYKKQSLKPMSKKEYYTRIEKAEENFKKGKIHTGKEVSAFIKKLHTKV